MLNIKHAKELSKQATMLLETAIKQTYPINSLCWYQRSARTGWAAVQVIAHGHSGRIKVMNRATGSEFWLCGDSDWLKPTCLHKETHSHSENGMSDMRRCVDCGTVLSGRELAELKVSA